MNFDMEALKRIDDERTIALLFLLVATYMFIGSYSYSARAATWPRFIALATICGSILVLFQNHLPGLIRTLVQEEYQAIERDEDMSDQAVDDNVTFNSRYAVLTTALIVGFGIAIVLFGYVVATVFFISMYTYYFDMDVRYSAVILLACLGILYVVGPSLNIPIFEGLADVIPRVTV